MDIATRPIPPLLLWVFVGCLVLTNSQATPSPSQWRNLTLLGANSDFYFLLATERNLPGSYYSFTEAWYLEKWRIADNKRVQRTHLRSASFADPSNGPSPQWEQTSEAVHQSLDIVQLLQDEKLMPPYPGGGLPSALKIRYHADQTLSLTFQGVDTPVSGPVDLMPERQRIRARYQAHGHVFLHIESGYPDDVGYKQVILPITDARRKTILEWYRVQRNAKRRPADSR